MCVICNIIAQTKCKQLATNTVNLEFLAAPAPAPHPGLNSLLTHQARPSRGVRIICRLLVLLELDLGDLAKHDGGVAVEERNAGETFARLELVDDEGVLGLSLIHISEPTRPY